MEFVLKVEPLPLPYAPWGEGTDSGVLKVGEVDTVGPSKVADDDAVGGVAGVTTFTPSAAQRARGAARAPRSRTAQGVWPLNLL